MRQPGFVSKSVLAIVTSIFALVLSVQALPATAESLDPVLMICGLVENEGGTGLAAGVELWNSYPDGRRVGETVAELNGYFCIEVPAGDNASTYDIRLILHGYCTVVEEVVTSPITDPVFVMAAVPEPSVTPYVADYWGTTTTQDGYSIRSGDVIMAYDPDGVLCGVTYVQYEGMYVVHVYGDDRGTTPAIDEGAVNGDKITFYLNCGCPLVAENPWVNHAFYDEDLNFECILRRPIPLCAPWILMSYNLEVEDPARESVLHSIDGQYTQVVSSTCLDGAISWDAARPPSLNDLVELNNRHCYWLFSDGQLDTLWITGAPVPPETPLELCAGWNAVSYLPNEPDATEHAWASIAGQFTYALGFECGLGARTYDPSRPADLNDLSCLRPGHGYWIEIKNPASLVYPGSGYSCAPPPVYTAREINSTTHVTPTPRVCDFWSAGGAAGLSAGSILTVRDEEGIICGESRVGSEGMFLVHVYGDEPTTAVDEGADRGSTLTFECDGALCEIVGNAVWTEHGSVEISPVKSGGAAPIPEKYELYQNYPNPFNAETAISFTLPSAASWELSIYDIVGRSVQEFEGHSAAGRVIVSWHASDNASGMYFYRLLAGKFTQTKKMTLMK